MIKTNLVLKTLFSSDTRVKVLAYFFLHPGEKFYPRQLEKLLEIPAGQFGRELIKLEKIQILQSSLEGNRKKYFINWAFLIYDELKTIFLKTTSAGGIIRKSLSELPGVELVFIYGSFAKGDEHRGSDLDIMIVSDVSDREIHNKVSVAENRLKRAINYSIYERKEVKNRLRKKDNIIAATFNEPKIILIGRNDNELFRTDSRQ